MVALPGAALLELITASTIIGPTIYAGTILLSVSVRGQPDRKESAFVLGGFEMPVAIGALVWSAIALVVRLILGGGVYFAYLFMSHREALEGEPGDVEIFKTSEREVTR